MWNRNLLVALSVAIVVLLALVLSPRYELRVIGDGRPLAYRIDKWTGVVSVVEARRDGMNGPFRASMREATEADAFDAALEAVRDEAR